MYARRRRPSVASPRRTSALTSLLGAATASIPSRIDASSASAWGWERRGRAREAAAPPDRHERLDVVELHGPL